MQHLQNKNKRGFKIGLSKSTIKKLQFSKTSERLSNLTIVNRSDEISKTFVVSNLPTDNKKYQRI
jgi:hypothetical protein